MLKPVMSYLAPCVGEKTTGTAFWAASTLCSVTRAPRKSPSAVEFIVPSWSKATVDPAGTKKVLPRTLREFTICPVSNRVTTPTAPAHAPLKVPGTDAGTEVRDSNSSRSPASVNFWSSEDTAMDHSLGRYPARVLKLARHQAAMDVCV